MTIRVNRNSNIKPKNKVNNEDICKKENENIENEEICDKFRNLIINNMNKQIRSKSLGNKTNIKKHIQLFFDIITYLYRNKIFQYKIVFNKYKKRF